MAAVSRQPFAPLDGARLKSLASIKNRQNAFKTSPGKRKAADVSDSEDDAENIEPVLFSKRSKGADLWGDLNQGFSKPAQTFILKPASSPAVRDILSPARPRSILKPTSPSPAWPPERLPLTTDSPDRHTRERAEGRDKENIPPPEDVSQTSSARSSAERAAAAASAGEFDDVLLEKEGAVFVVPGDEEDPEAKVDEEQEEIVPFEEEEEEQQTVGEEAQALAVAEEKEPEAQMADFDADDVDDIMGGNDCETKSAMLGPVEGPALSFELWESGSAKDEGSVPASPTRGVAEAMSDMF
ncbi:hypothetical protein N0V88_007888 [Collariella sp. IMI 366227]|nr:hypothetical protein N0V88_007888 [Collariella sp. IMI 366227]